MKFVCNKCRYRFELEKLPESCPYCGEEEGIKKEKDASELLEEVKGLKLEE